MSAVLTSFAVLAPSANGEPASAATTTCTDAACAGIPGDRVGVAQLLMSFTQGTAGVPGLSGLYPGIIPTIRDIASGKTPLGGGCDVDLRSLQLVAIVAKKYGSVQLTDLNRNCAGDSGATCDGKTISVSPVHCVEKMSPPQGIDFGWIGGLGSPSKSTSEKLLTFLSGVVPEGSRAETNCESAGYTNFSRFAATGCNHQHVDFLNSQGAALRIPAASAPAPAFPALRNNFTIGYQTSAGTLQTVNSSVQLSNWARPMAPKTSPSIAYLTKDTWQMAYIGSDSTLWMLNSAGQLAHPGMAVAPGTSPSITVLPNGKWVVAFVGSASVLYTLDSDSNVQNLGRPMAAGTSPSIAALADNRWLVAYQTNTGTLSMVSSSLEISAYGIGMAKDSSPDIAGMSNGTFALTFVGADNALYVINRSGLSKFGHWIAGGTSPSIAAMPNSEFVIAYQNADCTISAQTSSLKIANYGICMAAGSSPSIQMSSDGRWFTSFVTNTNLLYVVDSNQSLSNFGRQIAPGSSPSIN
ncbi:MULTISPECIES: hypothetical protein [unclassified Leifsonia]|uniref:hypothetical protein n=1 Tax=unclassified Leifsonia TaxID=2663824 RepID=UPI00105F6147|nr:MULTISPECIES: hypothetical protein [unclassified Leifsonia]